MRERLSRKLTTQAQAIQEQFRKKPREKTWSQRKVLAVGTLVLMSSMAFAPVAQAAGLMEIGSSGSGVRTLQTDLSNLGYSVGPLDGIFGPETLAAVEAFQSADHLQVDGIVGPLTENALGQAEAAKASGSTTAPAATGSTATSTTPSQTATLATTGSTATSATRNNTTAPTVTSSSTTSAKTSAIVAEAKKFLGVGYVWGGTTPSGFDCSGFTQYVFASQGISLPRTSVEQFAVGTPVAYADLKPGDLVFFSFTGNGQVSHVGIYLGNSQFISATTHEGIAIYSFSPYWLNAYKGARSVL